MELPTRPVPDGALESAWRALHEGRELPGELLRDPIRVSWNRSRMAEAPVDRVEVPYREPDGCAERLLRAAEPILSRFADRLSYTNVSIVLADPDARVVARWAGDHSALRGLARLSIDEGFVLAEDVAGTNGIGTVLEELQPVTVFGAEHYSEPLQQLVCVGAPVRNPLTRRIKGVLDLACPTDEATGLLVPTLLDLAAQIENELSARSSGRERVVFEEFLARSRETSAALVGISDRYMVTNAAAADLLDSRDQYVLWDQVAHARSSGMMSLALSGGAVMDARCTQIRIGSLLAGWLIEFTSVTDRPVATSARTSRHRRPDPEAELEELLDRAHGRIYVVGEQGTGKLTIATRLHGLLGPDEPMTTHPAGLVQVEGAASWLSRLEARLADPRGTAVVRNVEVLDDSVAQSLAHILDQHRNPQPLVIATHTLGRDNDQGSLRSRFGDAVLRLQPLRARRDDIADLVHTILGSAGHSTQVGHRAMSALVNFGWPGNFPQLEEVVRAAARRARGGPIGIGHIADEVGGGARVRRAQLSRLEALERAAIVDALRESHGNRARTATALGISRSTLYRRLRQFGLDSDRAII